jgi:hypothetical protein
MLCWNRWMMAMPNPRKQDRELDALYAQLPTIKCQGFCHDSCGPIDLSVRERTRKALQLRSCCGSTGRTDLFPINSITRFGTPPP